jgi:hypothetical protein
LEQGFLIQPRRRRASSGGEFLLLSEKNGFPHLFTLMPYLFFVFVLLQLTGDDGLSVPMSRVVA